MIVEETKSNRGMKSQRETKDEKHYNETVNKSQSNER